MSPITIDFEASCLPRDGRSFPIEVGICDERGVGQAWLIRPHAAWEGWAWTQEAEHLHGISRERLARDGLPAETVLAELCRAIGDRRVVADSHLDAYWLDILCEAAGTRATFAIEHLANVLDEMAPTADQAVHADETVAAMDFRRHRAGPDARYLALWLAALSNPPHAPALGNLASRGGALAPLPLNISLSI